MTAATRRPSATPGPEPRGSLAATTGRVLRQLRHDHRTDRA